MLELTQTLDTSERAELLLAEQTIAAGIRSFNEVGAALVKIRDLRLYRETHQTFEAYCSETWDLGRSQAYRLIDASEVVANLSPIGDAAPMPTNEAQVRPLAKLEPEQQQEAWQRAVETAPDGRVTAAHVERVVEEMTGPSCAAGAMDHDFGAYECKRCGSERPAEESDFPEVETNYAPAPAPAAVEVEVDLSMAPSSMGDQRKGKIVPTSLSNDWWTPELYVEAAREVLGSIDVDPASCAEANETVRAARYFTIDDNGLGRAWTGNVWLNPPYGTDEQGNSNAGRWAAELIRQFRSGETRAAILCVNALPFAPWFQQLWDFPICFTNHRVHFDSPSPDKQRPMNGTAFVYLGPDVSSFVEKFSSFGAVVRRIS